MVDNVTLNSGTGGAVAAADDISSVFFQRVKLTLGADGVNDGDVASGNPMPVSDAGGSLTVDGTITANAGSGTFTVDGSGVTQPVSAASLPLPSGAATSAAQLPDGHNVTIDNASGASAVNIQDGGNSITVDGTVTANLSATDNAVLDQIEVNTSYGDSVGGGTEAAALRVTIANNSTGLLSVDDNGGSLTVDGTVTANAGTGTFTVDGSGVTQPVSAASLPLPTGAATSAAQLPDGHNVTVDNASGASSVNIQDGGNSITVDGTVTADAGTGPWPVTDNGGSLTVDNGGTFATQATLQAGSALAADVGLSGARTSGGTTLYKNIDVDESEDQIKGTAGQVYWIHAVNVSATVKYLKFYNATAASVTVGTTVPDLTFPVPTQGDTNGAGFTLSIPNGIAFGTAITVAATTGVADNDSGAPGANEVIVNLGYA